MIYKIGYAISRNSAHRCVEFARLREFDAVKIDQHVRKLVHDVNMFVAALANSNAPAKMSLLVTLFCRCQDRSRHAPFEDKLRAHQRS